jgi:Tfp pilus assembly protein PilF
MAVFADVELRLQNYNEASKALKKILFTDTKNYSAYEQLLFCENILGRTDSVLFFGSEAIKKFPEMPVPYLFCGSANYRKNLYNRAIQNLEKGLGFSQNENLKVEFYSLLAECYSKIQNNEKSDDFFEKALLINPRNSIVCNNYAYYLAEREKNLSLALKLSEISLQSEPESSTYLDTYGWILFKKNITRKAKRTIERAIELGGGKNGEILLHYGEILLTLKKYKRSLEVLNSALMYADEEQTKEINGLVNKAKLKMKH